MLLQNLENHLQNSILYHLGSHNMGLDISYIAKARKVDCVFDGSGEPIDPITRQRLDDWTRAYVNPSFHGRADDVQDGAVYVGERQGGFSAGAYSGYGRWREQLAEFAGYPPTESRREEFAPKQLRHDEAAFNATSGPFWEQICFSDCEGVIGPTTSAKLASDYAANQEKADAHPDEWFRKKYAEWRKAFETAADGGFVEFH